MQEKVRVREGWEMETFDETWSNLLSVPEPEVARFIVAHTHDLTECEFCHEIYESGQQSIVGELLSSRYQGEGDRLPSADVLVAMCRAIDIVWETVDSWDAGTAAMWDLMRLTTFSDCTPETYDKLVGGLDWTFFRDQGWDFKDFASFLRERAVMPNAPRTFASRAANEYHMDRHEGRVDVCQECQGLIREVTAS